MSIKTTLFFFGLPLDRIDQRHRFCLPVFRSSPCQDSEPICHEQQPSNQFQVYCAKNNNNNIIIKCKLLCFFEFFFFLRRWCICCGQHDLQIRCARTVIDLKKRVLFLFALLFHTTTQLQCFILLEQRIGIWENLLNIESWQKTSHHWVRFKRKEH